MLCLNSCGKEAKVKFCSRSCAATFNNTKEPKRKLSHTCFICQVPVQRGHKYCLDCRVTSATKVQSWLDGNWDGNMINNQGLSQIISDYLKREANWKCQSPNCCVSGGWSVVHPSTGRVPVTVDHIDGNYLNQRPDNLIVLCPNCHSLTPTYGSLNKNGGRKFRLKGVTL